jgi:hypothetical protein
MTKPPIAYFLYKNFESFLGYPLWKVAMLCNRDSMPSGYVGWVGGSFPKTCRGERTVRWVAVTYVGYAPLHSVQKIIPRVHSPSFSGLICCLLCYALLHSIYYAMTPLHSLQKIIPRVHSPSFSGLICCLPVTPFEHNKARGKSKMATPESVPRVLVIPTI